VLCCSMLLLVMSLACGPVLCCSALLLVVLLVRGPVLCHSMLLLVVSTWSCVMPQHTAACRIIGMWSCIMPWLRSDTGFLAFLFPRSLGSGVYDEINEGQRKLVRTYLSYISTKFRLIWISFGACISKTLCQTHGYRGMGLARCFAYTYTKTNLNWSKFGGDITQISVHQFLLSSINFVINSTPQGPWE